MPSAAHLTKYQFPKGISGNPKGHARGDLAAEVRRRTLGGRLLVDFWLSLVQNTGEFATHPSPLRWRVEASKCLAERGFGRPAILDAAGTPMTEIAPTAIVFTPLVGASGLDGTQVAMPVVPEPIEGEVRVSEPVSPTRPDDLQWDRDKQQWLTPKRKIVNP